MLDQSFFGVYDTKGELQAVEHSLDAATQTARMLSPTSGDKPPTNPIGFTVEPVSVIRGEYERFVLSVLALASDRVIQVLTDKYQGAIAEATFIDEKTGRPIVNADHNVHSAQKKLRTALAIRLAL